MKNSARKESRNDSPTGKFLNTDKSASYTGADRTAALKPLGYAQIRDAEYADPNKQPFTNDDFENEVENLRRFARERGDFVKKAVAASRPQ